MLPVALVAVGAGFDRATVLFVGWFGPRGLASLVFALLALEELGAGADDAVAAIAVTVLLSVVAHGATAAPLAARYGRAVAGEDTPDGPGTDVPVRGLPRRRGQEPPAGDGSGLPISDRDATATTRPHAVANAPRVRSGRTPAKVRCQVR